MTTTTMPNRRLDDTATAAKFVTPSMARGLDHRGLRLSSGPDHYFTLSALLPADPSLTPVAAEPGTSHRPRMYSPPPTAPGRSRRFALG